LPAQKSAQVIENKGAFLSRYVYRRVNGLGTKGATGGDPRVDGDDGRDSWGTIA